MVYEISIRKLERQPTAMVRFTCAPAEMPSRLGDAFGKVGQYLAEAGKEHEIAGVYARYLGFGAQFDVEAGFIVRSRVDGSGGVRPGELPECEAAVTTHLGPYAQVESAYHAIQQWIAEQKRAPASGPWELYLNDPGDTPEQELRTELYQPLVPAS